MLLSFSCSKGGEYFPCGMSFNTLRSRCKRFINEIEWWSLTTIVFNQGLGKIKAEQGRLEAKIWNNTYDYNIETNSKKAISLIGIRSTRLRANSPTPTCLRLLVNWTTQADLITVIGKFVVHSCLRCIVKCVCSANLKIPVSSQKFCVKTVNWMS